MFSFSSALSVVVVVAAAAIAFPALENQFAATDMQKVRGRETESNRYGKCCITTNSPILLRTKSQRIEGGRETELTRLLISISSSPTAGRT